MDGLERAGRLGRSGRLVAAGFGLLLLAAFAEAQSAPVLKISPELPREGQQFTLSFFIPHPSAEEVRVGPGVQFPSSAVLLGGPGIYPVSEKDPVTGNIERLVKIQYAFRAGPAGRGIVEPIPYRIDGREYATEGLVLEIAQKRGEPLVPFDLAWRIPVVEIYEGQTVPALLEMHNLPGIAVPEAVSVSPPSGVVFEEAKGLGTIGSRAIGGRELYRMAVASYLMTPSSAGRVVLPPARVKALGMTVDSGRLAVSVRPLPAGVKATGAVGNLRVTSRVDREDPRLGDTIHLFVRVEGEGNLNYLQLPAMQFPDFAATGRTSRSSLIPKEFGYSGFVEWEIRLSPQKTGEYRLTVPAFPWLDPAAGEVKITRERQHRIVVLEADISENPEDPRQTLRIMRSAEVLAYEPWNLYMKPYAYLPLLLGLLLLIQGLLRRRGKSLLALFGILAASILLPGATAPDRAKGIPLVEQGADAYDQGKYSDAAKYFLQAVSELPRSPGVHYNLGLAYRAMNNTPRAVFHLRTSAVLRPGSALFRDTLAAEERSHGLSRQVDPPRFPPDYFFLLLIFSFSLACALPWFVKKRGMLFISFILFLLIIGSSVGGIWYAASVQNAGWGVVLAENAELRKIPLPNSSEWLYLQEGTSALVRGHSGKYVLVRTGFGVEGWIETDKILLHRTEISDER